MKSIHQYHLRWIVNIIYLDWGTNRGVDLKQIFFQVPTEVWIKKKTIQELREVRIFNKYFLKDSKINELEITKEYFTKDSMIEKRGIFKDILPSTQGSINVDFLTKFSEDTESHNLT